MQLFTFDWTLPEISLQFFLLKQSWYNRTHQDFIGNGSDQEVSKDADGTDPAGAERKVDFTSSALHY